MLTAAPPRVLPDLAPAKKPLREVGTLHLHVKESLHEVGIALMQCRRARRIVDTVAMRKGLPKSSHDAVLLTEVWLRLGPYIPFQDEPDHIYSLVWRIAEFAAMDLRRENTTKEVLEADMSESEVELVMGRHSDDGVSLEATERVIDQHAAQKRFAEKLKRVGWDPDADPGKYQAVTAPGRRPNSEKKDPDN